MGLDVWWVWIAAGLVLAILELVVPAYIFLGFAIGAGMVGTLLMIGGPASAWFAGSTGLTLVVFGSASLLAWTALRRVMGVRRGQRRVWTRDINED